MTITSWCLLTSRKIIQEKNNKELKNHKSKKSMWCKWITLVSRNLEMTYGLSQSTQFASFGLWISHDEIAINLWLQIWLCDKKKKCMRRMKSKIKVDSQLFTKGCTFFSLKGNDCLPLKVNSLNNTFESVPENWN